MWEALFSPQPVGIRDDFFTDLGGHSLLASKMISELRKRANFSDLAVLDVYKHPTVASLAAHLEQRQAEAPSNQPGSLAKDRLPPSPRAHLLCGVVQLIALYVIVGFASLFFLVPYLTWGWLAEYYPFALAVAQRWPSAT